MAYSNVYASTTLFELSFGRNIVAVDGVSSKRDKHHRSIMSETNIWGNNNIYNAKNHKINNKASYLTHD